MEEEMGLKRKQIVMRQKDAFEQELKDRLSFLSQKGIKAPQVDRDPIVKRLKANVKASKKRLAKIADLDKRTEDMIRIKAEKAAAPKVEEQKAAKPKAAPEGKAKKPKAPVEGAKGQKKAEAPAEAKVPKKKAEEPKEEPPVKAT